MIKGIYRKFRNYVMHLDIPPYPLLGHSDFMRKNRRKFGNINGAVALDLDERPAGWKLRIGQSMAIKPAEVWEILDGVVVY